MAVVGQAIGTEPLVFGRDIRWPVINELGDLLFYADTIDPITDVRRVGYWVANDAETERGPPLTDFLFGFSDRGQVAFSRVVIGRQFDFGVYVGDLQSQTVTLQSGSPAPGTDSVFGYPQRPSVNDDGHFAVHVTLGPTAGPPEGTGIWMGNGTSLTPVALSGESAPGTLAAFESFAYYPSMNNAGQIAFSGDLRGDEISQNNRQGLWKGIPGSLRKVAQQGDPAPGANAYFGQLALYGSDSFHSSEASYFALNNEGQVAFVATLTGQDVTPETDSGLWAESTTGELTLRLREGDLISVGPNDFRQVSAFQFRTGGGVQEIYGGGFTDLGHLALRVSFTDGSEAVLINNAVAIPEPSALVTLLIGMTAISVGVRNGARKGNGRQISFRGRPRERWVCSNPSAATVRCLQGALPKGALLRCFGTCVTPCSVRVFLGRLPRVAFDKLRQPWLRYVTALR